MPHFVTVTSPGGRVEVFDLVPAPSGPLLSLTTPAFVPRPGTGTTSKLEDADPPTLSLAGTSLADFFGGTIYDPTLFRLTTKDGIVLIIDRFDGLQSMTDRNGNKLIVSSDGVTLDVDRPPSDVRAGRRRPDHRDPRPGREAHAVHLLGVRATFAPSRPRTAASTRSRTTAAIDSSPSTARATRGCGR